MLMATSSLRVFAHRDPTDMRKSFSGLVGLVETELGQQIESGDLFLFFNRRRDRVKVLYFVGDGLVIFYRMLERGTFEVPAATDAKVDTAGVELRLSDLTLILEGIELSSVKRRKRWRREPQPT
jgi:transposase